MLVSPLASFLVALRFYKNWISQFFMLVFAFYFGMKMYCGDDLIMHYQNMRMWYVNKSFSEIITNPYAVMAGKDYYHVILKYLISRVSSSREFFAAVNCVLYSGMFLFFFNQLKRFYKQFLPISCGILLLCVIFTVEFYWYGGVRFWIGVFYFAGFYLKYLNTGKKRYLAISFTAIFFHYTLINLLFIWAVNWVLSKFWWGFRAIFLAIALFVRTLNFDLMAFIMRKLPWLDLGSRTDSYIHENMQRATQYMRENPNIFYAYRLDLMLVFAVLILMIFWSRRVKFNPKYLELFFYALTIFTFVNIGYSEIIFYFRFYKIAILLLYTFIFITACENYEKYKGVSLIIMILAFVPAFYAMLTPIIESRAHIFDSHLWFGNFFTDWDGGFSLRHGKRFVD